jgi:hypothetical protein
MNSSNKKKYLLELLEKSDNNILDKQHYSEELIKKIMEEDHFPHYLENKNFEIIQQEIKNICFRENIPTKNIIDKLGEYRYVDKICDLIRGKFVRWIRLTNQSTLTKGGTQNQSTLTKGGTQNQSTLTKGGTQNQSNLTKGGIVADIKFLENGTYILVKNALNRFIQYKYDECITFQKLSVEEILYINIC